ncbi:MAG: carbamoyl-phosphate synthase large subunit [candidate division KSB1 bacterium]|nr:carbamoyl-phosphate synthase large subunit [candidate division KSB1 bacterium]MDZ7340443.1 carbamoyl-phosphate synthase large subunit [candidate division KSB1 bacterium]
MPKRTDIQKILLIGSGPIVIGQACEFDYSGTQACRALTEEGYQVILVNSNPATIMTDPDLAYRTYIEPLTAGVITKIIEKERPDALLPTMGGQVSLNLATELYQTGVLEKYQVQLIGASFEAIQKAECREKFKQTIETIGLDLPLGGLAHSVDEAMAMVGRIPFPLIIRPAFTLGGTGGSTAYNIEEFRDKVIWGLNQSPISEVLIEESISGWKEFELEVMRDLKDNVVIICSIENLDPMGIHTGDSITVAPAQTLTDREYQAMRDAAIRIIREIGVDTGGSNIQFAINPTNGRLVVIEMNPRVSRSSALASKATGFPIAKIAAKLAIGLTLDEIPNDITKKTPASFEPTIDYVVVKIPRWDMGKFPKADRTLGTQMKSVGEIMAIGRTFKEALGKGLRSLEIDRYGLEDISHVLHQNGHEDFFSIGEVIENLRQQLKKPTGGRIFWLGSALRAGLSEQEIHELTGIDPWFISQIKEVILFEKSLSSGRTQVEEMTEDILRTAKALGISDRRLAHLMQTDEEIIRAARTRLGVCPVYKTVDTCAAEFESTTPYFYSTYEQENEAIRSSRKKIMILGGGPNRIGQGIEFDYCCVHAIMAFREAGYETIMVNCNPETVSTDYDVADKLYFEPLTLEDLLPIIENEKPDGVVVQFGGQTPLKLALALEQAGAPIIGTSPDAIDLAEDRQRFGELIQELNLRQPNHGIAFSADEALQVAERIGFPVLLRPSYVLGGRAMEIIYDRLALKNYMQRAVQVSSGHPVLIDQFLEDAFEVDVDAVCDGEDVFIGGIMQHIEEAGIHSGDSSCVLPSYMIKAQHLDQMRQQTRELALALRVKGLINIQFAIKDDILYVLEVNPRASRTVPFVSKATGIPLAKIAARVMVGDRLRSMGFLTEVKPKAIAVKTPVFPFAKFPGADNHLGPEMRSTGEVMGVADNFGLAFAKSLLSAGARLPLEGTVFISVNDFDKPKATIIAKELANLGFRIVATRGTAAALRQAGIQAETIYKLTEDRPHVVDHIINGHIQMIINTPLGKNSRADEYAMDRAAIQYNIPCLTTLSASFAAIEAIRELQKNHDGLAVTSLQEYASR